MISPIQGGVVLWRRVEKCTMRHHTEGEQQ